MCRRESPRDGVAHRRGVGGVGAPVGVSQLSPCRVRVGCVKTEHGNEAMSRLHMKIEFDSRRAPPAPLAPLALSVRLGARAPLPRRLVPTSVVRAVPLY
eukprot:680774-Prymnesium_polylepis.1